MSLPVNSTVDPGEVTTKRKRDVENAGKVGLEEMHHPERAKECAQSNPCAGAQQGGQNDKIKECICGKQKNVFEFSHCPT